MKVQLIVLNVKQGMTFNALGYHCQTFKQWRERKSSPPRSASYIQFLLRITFLCAQCEHVSNLIVKWDIAKNISPLLSGKWCRMELSYSTED